MDKNSETTDTKPAGKKDAPQAFREIAEKGPTQANETYEKMNAATIEASEVIKNSYSTAVKGMQAITTRSSNSLMRTLMPLSTLSRRCPA